MIERRRFLGGLALLPLSGPLSPAAGSWVPPAPVPGAKLRVALWDAEERLLARKVVPFARHLTVAWPRWLLPAAHNLQVDDGAYRAGWPIEVLGVAEGIFSFRVTVTWLMWPRPELVEPWWGTG